MTVFLFGRSVGIRTRGLLDPNQARYQTSPHLDTAVLYPKTFRLSSAAAAFFRL